ncbi:MAG: hypothetical protein QM775_24495 [Pirellulales bacterium]
MFEGLRELRRVRKDPRTCRTLFIGPPKAGKTSYLAALTLAGATDEPDERQVYCALRPGNEKMLQLHEAAAESITRGRLPNKATEMVNAYEFAFEARYPDSTSQFFFGNSRSVDFEMIDGPGGALIPNQEPGAPPPAFPDDGPFLADLVAAAERSQSLVFCVDSTNDRAVGRILQVYSPFIGHAECRGDLSRRNHHPPDES